MIKNISNLGDAAVYCDFGNDVNKEINSKVINYFQSLKDSKFEGITNLTPSYNKLIVSFDLSITNCYMTGFIAGMPFLGDIDKNLHAKRLETPRVKVPKGSIGLTEQFCNIYTFESPGGWNIIGNTPLNVFDSLNEDNPNLINPGDTVSFIKINKEKYKNYNE